MASYPRWRRRKILVNFQQQGRFVALLLLQMSFVLATLGLLIYSHVTTTAEVAFNFTGPDSRTNLALQQEVIDNIHGFYMRSLVLLAVAVAALVLFGLLASHKLAGPVLKLRRYLDGVAAGDYGQRIAFRQKDNLDEFAMHINCMADAIERRRSQARDILLQLVRLGGQVESRAECGRYLGDAERLIAAYKEAV